MHNVTVDQNHGKLEAGPVDEPCAEGNLDAKIAKVQDKEELPDGEEDFWSIAGDYLLPSSRFTSESIKCSSRIVFLNPTKVH